MSEKQGKETIRFSQVTSGALAAITAAVLGSTMGVAGTVIGAGLASVVTTVGGALYLRSIQRTREGVRTVRDIVVARAGATSVTLVEERPVPEPDADSRTDGAAEANAEAETEADAAAEQDVEQEFDEQPQRRRMRWPALMSASVLAFFLGMVVVTGVEWLRGEPLSGGEGTTVGGIVRAQPDSGDDRDDAPPVGPGSTTPETGAPTVTVTETPPTSENTEPAEPPAGSGTPETTAPETTTGGTPTGSVSVPVPGEIG